MKLWKLENLTNIPKLKLAVVGHIEWVRFLSVDQLPKAGCISHAKKQIDYPAGGGTLTALEMQSIIKEPVHFFTSLGKDPVGEKCYKELEKFGLKLNVAWRDSPTRKGISFVDSNGERAITVIGERLQPSGLDNLPWEELDNFDGVFLTAADSKAIHFSRKAKLLAATPRIGIKELNKSNSQLDILIGSGLDPGEKYNLEEINKPPRIRISTEGSNGGQAFPGGHFKAVNLNSKIVDTYGCGDKFAAGVVTGLASNWDLEKAISLGAHCGARCTTYFGPYSEIN